MGILTDGLLKFISEKDDELPGVTAESAAKTIMGDGSHNTPTIMDGLGGDGYGELNVGPGGDIMVTGEGFGDGISLNQFGSDVSGPPDDWTFAPGDKPDPGIWPGYQGQYPPQSGGQFTPPYNHMTDMPLWPGYEGGYPPTPPTTQEKYGMEGEQNPWLQKKEFEAMMRKHGEGGGLVPPRRPQDGDYNRRWGQGGYKPGGTYKPGKWRLW